MILITHPRCGSEWFLKGLPHHRYSGWEILGRLNRIVGTSEPVFRSIPLSTRVFMLENRPPNHAHKLHTHDVRRAYGTPYWDRISKAISKYDDTYLLYRRNARQAAVSYWVATLNNLNYHQENELLKPCTITQQHLNTFFFEFYQELEWVKSLFNFKEVFVYEDLVSGVQVPTTVEWNPAESPVQRRDTAGRFRHLVTNLDEVQQMMAAMQMPGDL